MILESQIKGREKEKKKFFKKIHTQSQKQRTLWPLYSRNKQGYLFHPPLIVRRTNLYWKILLFGNWKMANMLMEYCFTLPHKLGDNVHFLWFTQSGWILQRGSVQQHFLQWWQCSLVDYTIQQSLATSAWELAICLKPLRNWRTRDLASEALLA